MIRFNLIVVVRGVIMATFKQLQNMIITALREYNQEDYIIKHTQEELIKKKLERIKLK